MTVDKNRRLAIDDMTYLVSCAIREITPNRERVAQMDLDLVYQEASRQLLASCCAFALESADMCTESFTKAKGKAIRKVVLFDQQRKEVLEKLEDAGIWYMPLKGSVLKDYYPSIGMREMSDNDVLFDATRTDDMRAIMAQLGFESKGLGVGAHDNFYKKPIYNFEMHRTLFAMEYDANLVSYYENIKDRLVPDIGNCYGFHFTPEDFYLFMIAHEYKHYVLSGTGLRSCVDIYVYLTKNELNLDYIKSEAQKMGIADFEHASRNLSLHLVEGGKLAQDEKDVLVYMQQSGVYGNISSAVEHKVEKYGGGLRGKLRYIRKRILVPEDAARAHYPFFYRHRFLLPLLPLVRFGKMLTISRKRVINEIKTLRKHQR